MREAVPCDRLRSCNSRNDLCGGTQRSSGRKLPTIIRQHPYCACELAWISGLRNEYHKLCIHVHV
eukprot:4819551-Heterocapsa_arctica.AAC.1